MKASVVDLRYHMNEVFKALERNEEVEILYYGEHKGTIIPKKKEATHTVQEHPFFGMTRQEKQSVTEQMSKLRGGRYNDI